MCLVHAVAEYSLLFVGAFGCDSEVAEGGAAPLVRVVEQATRFDAAFEYAVADAWPGQLHDDVRGARGKADAVHRIIETCGFFDRGHAELSSEVENCLRLYSDERRA